ncbi:hypothetical protein MMC29_000050 [Sticta canariensis]|nr:hypothetical protein [Sticta canariensis]
MSLFQLSQPTLLDRIWLFIRYPYDLVKPPMDALLSIPALSFLVIPIYSSYSTSLNLIFFYLTWSTLILSNSPLKVEIIGTLAIRLLFYILPSLGFLFFDSALPSLAVNIKEHGDQALPLSNESDVRKGRWWKIALVSTGNVLLGVGLQAGIELLFTEVFHIRSALKVTTAIPLPWGIAIDLFRGLLLREVCLLSLSRMNFELIVSSFQGFTYLLHRYALHSPPSALHNLHTSWQHSVSPPYALVANYDHPLPYVIHVFLPTYLPAVMSRFHLLTYYLYLAIVSIEETFAYSGYNALPNGFILGGIARRQERHLMGDGMGNYGCFGLLDLLIGTSLGDDVLDDIREEAEKKKTREKGKGRARGSGRAKR